MMLPRLEVNPNLDQYVPDHLENKQNLKILDSIFGGSEMIMLMLQAPDVVNPSTFMRLGSISEAVDTLEGIDQVISPFQALEISYDDGFTLMDPLLENIPEKRAELDVLKQKIASNSMAKRFFSEDFTLVALILSKNKEAPDDVIEQLKEIVESYPGDEEAIIGGLPFLRYSISGNIRSDLMVLIPIALVLMVFMLYFSFREWKGVFMPFIIVVMSVILSFAIMAFLGWKISLITVLMPIMLIAIANDYGIHMIARYQEFARMENPPPMKEICKRTYSDLKHPIIITGLTTIGGVLGLLTHTMIPAAQLGILISFGIGFALILSVWFLPSLLSYFKVPGKKEKGKRKIALADRWLNRFGEWVSVHPKRIISIAVLAGITGTMGILLIRVDTNIEGYFLGKSEVRKSTEIINNKFGGSQFVSVLFSGDVLAPELLKRMETYEQKLVNDPLIGNISSAASLLRELSKGFYAPEEEGYDQIPGTADEAYQFLEIYSMSDDGDALEQFIDYNYENARMVVSLKNGSNRAGKELRRRLKELTKDDPDVVAVTGTSFTRIELADMVVSGQIKSLILAMLVVFVLLSLVFRSGRAGMLSALPLSVAILILFGLMGFLGIALDIATALLSSIMIGVGVDYTIHFLWRFKVERANGYEHREAARITLTTAGRGIIFNAVSVIVGFLALSFSNFAPMRFFSALIVISIASCLISALLLVPSIIILVKPKFLDPK